MSDTISTTLALVREAELDAMADWLATSREAPLSVSGLARWAETHGRRLIATASAYLALRAAVLAMDDGSFPREEFPDDRVLCVDLDDMLAVRAVIERTAI